MFNSSNTSDVVDETTNILNVFNYLLYTLIVLLGVPGNVLVVWSLLNVRREQRHNRSFKILVINLAINDIIIVLTTAPFTITELSSSPRYPFGRIMCSILWPLQTACYGAGVFNMVALNIHRYLLIAHPTCSKSLRNATVFAVALCWIIPSLITALPYALVLRYNDKKSECTETWSGHSASIFTIYLFALQYILPLLLIATLNILTIRRLKRRHKFQLNSARMSDDNLHSHRKIVKMLIIIIVIFALFGLPGQIMWLLPVITDIDFDAEYYTVLSLVDVFNFFYCVLNPVIFFTYNNECYNNLKKFFAPILFCCDQSWDMSSPSGKRREAVTTLLNTSRTSDSQETNSSERPKFDSKYAPAFPKEMLERFDRNTRQDICDKNLNSHSVSAALFSTVAGFYTSVALDEKSDVETKPSSQVITVARNEEIFSESFLELLRTKNINEDLIQRLNASPETELVEV